MTASNLGMVFGPTLMRPERADHDQDSVDIKYRNIIIEMMINEMETVNVCVYVGPQTVPDSFKVNLSVTFQSSFFKGIV